jgi:hypothetical protein
MERCASKCAQAIVRCADSLTVYVQNAWTALMERRASKCAQAIVRCADSLTAPARNVRTDTLELHVEYALLFAGRENVIRWTGNAVGAWRVFMGMNATSGAHRTAQKASVSRTMGRASRVRHTERELRVMWMRKQGASSVLCMRLRAS